MIGLEQLQAKLESVNMKIHPDTIYTCFVHGLPEVEYAQEIRDIGLMDGYDRDAIMRITRNRYEILQGRNDFQPACVIQPSRTRERSPRGWWMRKARSGSRRKEVRR